MEKIIKKNRKCRVCKSKNLLKVLSFGPTPLANAFLSSEQIDFEESFYPLDVYFCNNCTFLQLGHVVSPKTLFNDYVYVSSTSPVFVNHFKMFANEIILRFSLNKSSLIIDIGSNDGILLKPFKNQGIKVLGIEPAAHIADIAKKDGINTIPEFFSVNLAKKIVKTHGKAKIVTATNVFAHIDDLDEVIKGIKVLLEDDGVFVMEAPYLVDFIEKRYFDLVYHEHLSYWAIKPLITLFSRFNMTLFDVQKVNSHGGSIRIFVKKNNSLYKVLKSIDNSLKLEKKYKLNDKNTFLKYSNLVLKNRLQLMGLLTNLKLKNKKIVGYGAPAKGNTLLNYFKIGSDLLDYIIDDSPFKQGLYTPGTHIPVYSAQKIKEDKPDYILILAWNFAKPIMEKYSWFEKEKGKFIIPVPTPKII